MLLGSGMILAEIFFKHTRSTSLERFALQPRWSISQFEAELNFQAVVKFGAD